jgi:hypothetical protein
MKHTLFAPLLLALTLSASAQDETPTEPKNVPPTEEERFYDGPQVNVDEFNQDGRQPDREEEVEAIPYDHSKEIYPYSDTQEPVEPRDTDKSIYEPQP